MEKEKASLKASYSAIHSYLTNNSEREFIISKIYMYVFRPTHNAPK